MNQSINPEVLESAFTFVRDRVGECNPKWGLIMGSGWGEIISIFSLKVSIPYREIPGLGAAGVSGHAGILHLAEIGTTQVLIFQGRRHWYEGVGWTPIAIPIFLMKRCKVSNVVLTNAAGGISTSFRVGDLMMLTDHINCMGVSILNGPRLPEFGPRFPDMSCVYDRELRATMLAAAKTQGIAVQQGVYCAMNGPQFETPAEIQMCGRLGADAVGMSTVPEAVLANAAGLKVLGLSCISNLAAGISNNPLSQEEVEETGRKSAHKIKKLLKEFWS